MFSQEPRCQLSKAPLAYVVCQLQFPEILSIDTQSPARFQEAIRQRFPITESRAIPPALAAISHRAGHTEYGFSPADGSCRLSLSTGDISLTSSQYPGWEEFADILDQPLAAFIGLYHPAMFTRIGLRYVNFISRSALELTDTPFRELISPCYLGVLAEDDLSGAAVSRSTTDSELTLSGCTVKIHSGPGYVRQGSVPDPEIKFVLDLDLSQSGRIPVSQSAHVLQTLHQLAWPLFRGAITDTLFQSLL